MKKLLLTIPALLVILAGCDSSALSVANTDDGKKSEEESKQSENKTDEEKKQDDLSIQSITDAMAAMNPGWNLGNTLESNSGDLENMWIEAYSSRTTQDYETAWGQPVTTRALIHMFKEAGFKAIRVPVTWYPHMGKLTVTTGQNAAGEWKGFWDPEKNWTGTDVDAVWMARVKEVVNYVIDEGMYCILNVHHDTGESTTAWLRASEEVYEAQKERYEALWKQIALEFRDYPQTLLFESYNEMLDPYSSWCFASYATKNRYDSAVANSAYKAINGYAQTFVNTVRATGGLNASRNLIVNTYGACSGAGTWNNHLKDPLKNMALPSDSVKDHIAFEIHSYWDVSSNQESSVNDMFSALASNLQTKAPVVIGEWGVTSDLSTSAGMQNAADFAEMFVRKAKAAGCPTFWWMGLSDGADRSVPKWTQPLIKDAIIKGSAD